jgi:hypothetical protein
VETQLTTWEAEYRYRFKDTGGSREPGTHTRQTQEPHKPTSKPTPPTDSRARPHPNPGTHASPHTTPLTRSSAVVVRNLNRVNPFFLTKQKVVAHRAERQSKLACLLAERRLWEMNFRKFSTSQSMKLLVAVCERADVTKPMKRFHIGGLHESLPCTKDGIYTLVQL